MPLILFFLSFITFFPQFILSLTHPDEITALKSFKSSITPSSIPNWSCLATWDFSTTDPCSLPHRTNFICGLTCTSTSPSHITSITLDSVNYTGILTPLLYKLKYLTHLDLTDNSFHGLIPFSSLPSSLESLALSGNSFSGSISISNLNSLQILDLSNNKLTGLIPTLTTLTSLTRLDFSNNKLTGSIPTLPSNLIVLIIRSNSLTGPLTKPTFTSCHNLQVVDLTANSISGSFPYWFLNLPSIQQINLSNNTLTSIESPPLHPIPLTANELVSIDLGFNQIQGNIPSNFAKLPSLWALSMRYNQLTGRIPDEFGNNGKETRRLKRLFLDGNYLIGKPSAGVLSVEDGSFGDNCLEVCPKTSKLCVPSQKSMSVCRRAYHRKGKKGRKLPRRSV